MQDPASINDQSFGWCRLYHPSGAQISLPVSLFTAITPQMANTVNESISNLLTSGFSVQAPGLDSGQSSEEVVSVSKRMNRDGTVPIVAFFVSHPKMTKKFIHHYLDTPEDIAAFEAGTGLRLADIPTFDADKDPEKTHPKASKFIIPLPHPVSIVWEINPKWSTWSTEGKQGTEPQKRLLVRYGPTAKSSPKEALQEPGQNKPGQEETGEVFEKLSSVFIGMLTKETGLKPAVLAPILARHPSKTITLTEALRLINDNSNKD